MLASVSVLVMDELACICIKPLLTMSSLSLPIWGWVWFFSHVCFLFPAVSLSDPILMSSLAYFMFHYLTTTIVKL